MPLTTYLLILTNFKAVGRSKNLCGGGIMSARPPVGRFDGQESDIYITGMAEAGERGSVRPPPLQILAEKKAPHYHLPTQIFRPSAIIKLEY